MGAQWCLPFLVLASLSCGGDNATGLVTTQTWEVGIGSTADELANAIVVTPDGGYAVVGAVIFPGDMNLFAARVGIHGDTMWTREFGGLRAEVGYAVAVTSDGGMVAAGKTESAGLGPTDMFAVRLGPDGEELWRHTYGGSKHEEAHAVVSLADGGFLLAGSTDSWGAGGWDILIVRTNHQGEVLWQHTLGDERDNRARACVPTADGGFVVAGWTAVGNDIRVVHKGVHLLKLDASGVIEWETVYSDSLSRMARSVIQTADGGFLIAGEQNHPDLGSLDGLLIKFDASGDIVWQRALGGAFDDALYGGVQALDGGYVAAGWSRSFRPDDDVYLVKVDSDGNDVWVRNDERKEFGGESFDNGYALQRTPDGGFIIAGRTRSLGNGGQDAYLIKTNADGEL